MDLVQLLLYSALIAGTTFVYLHFFFYDTKSRVKRLWKEIRQLDNYLLDSSTIKAKEIAGYDLLGERYEARQEQAGALINALLEYSLSNNEDDNEYVAANKWARRKN